MAIALPVVKGAANLSLVIEAAGILSAVIEFAGIEAATLIPAPFAENSVAPVLLLILKLLSESSVIELTVIVPAIFYSLGYFNLTA
jgi:hypothetical protein